MRFVMLKTAADGRPGFLVDVVVQLLRKSAVWNQTLRHLVSEISPGKSLLVLVGRRIRASSAMLWQRMLAPKTFTTV